MRPERIAIYVCACVIYAATLAGAIIVPSVAAQMTEPARRQIVDLEPQIGAAREATSMASREKDSVQLRSLQLQIRALQEQVASACAAQPSFANPTQTLLQLSQTIQSNLEPAVTLSSYDLDIAAPATPSSKGTPTPAASPQDNSTTSVSAMQDPSQVDQATSVSPTKAIVSGPALSLTFHGPFPAIMQTLDRLTHREPAIAFAATSVSRATTNDGVDAQFTVTPDRVPVGLCPPSVSTTSQRVERRPIAKPTPHSSVFIEHTQRPAHHVALRAVAPAQLSTPPRGIVRLQRALTSPSTHAAITAHANRKPVSAPSISPHGSMFERKAAPGGAKP